MSQVPITPQDLDYRKELARILIPEGRTEVDLMMQPNLSVLPVDQALTADLGLQFPQDLAPIPQELPNPPDPNAPLPAADVLVVTWTVDEQMGMCDVLTPGFNRNAWYRYRHLFDQNFRSQIRAGAPSLQANRLGSWFPIMIGNKKVICMKSELHLNQDGISDPNNPGHATLPVKDFFKQMIAETGASHVLTVGTAGATFPDHDLGDVVVTRGAKFRLQSEFGQESFRNDVYQSNWDVPLMHFQTATDLMAGFASRLKEPKSVAPTVRYEIGKVPTNDPSIVLDGRDMPAFHPILTTDFFEFGTSANGLQNIGCAVEMGDAALGLACQEIGAGAPKWLIVRNLSDPQINADLPGGPRETNLQSAWAVYYYRTYGYWTSVNSALATWAIIAGL